MAGSLVGLSIRRAATSQPAAIRARPTSVKNNTRKNGGTGTSSFNQMVDCDLGISRRTAAGSWQTSVTLPYFHRGAWQDETDVRCAAICGCHTVGGDALMRPIYKPIGR